MDPQLPVVLAQTVIPIFILVILVWKKQWQLLLGISILAASSGFFALNLYILGDTSGTVPWCSSYTETAVIRCMQTHITMLELTAIAFLKAIFILILAIFAWLQKEAEKKHRLY